MKFMCEIDMNNDAFNEDPMNEFRNIMRGVTAKVSNGSTSGVLMDSNGNRVGKYEMTED